VSTPEPETTVAIAARLSLFGFVSTPAVLHATPRPKSERVTRSMLTLLATVIGAPIAFLIPPHIECLVMTVITGTYWVRKQWVAEYVVASCDSVCPRCYAAITIKAGTTLRLPHSVVCYGCHEHPALETGEAPPVDPANRTDSGEPDRPVGERRPLRIWSPAGSDW
jgi:hypothetical protein